MAIIYAYSNDTNVQDDDAWIGTNASNRVTKQFTAGAVAEYLNINGKVSIGAQMVFKYIEQPLTDVGSFSITTGGVNNIPFANITVLTLSIIDRGDQNTVAFLDHLVGSDILISEQSEISTFGHYDLISYSVNAVDASYYDMVVNYKGGNGILSFDKYYDVINFALAADSTDKTFIFNQGVPAVQWVISHNLGKFPAVSVVNNNKVLINGEVIYIDNNNLEVNFSAGFAGQAYLN
tara:strand:+ start:435 stop:1139 length:705 start_codon:yes stop_codon:yes gene_type:complete